MRANACNGTRFLTRVCAKKVRAFCVCVGRLSLTCTVSFCVTLNKFVVRFGSTPLHQAAYFGHCDCALVLLAAGAMVNVEEAWGQTPLFLAAQRAHRFVV